MSDSTAARVQEIYTKVPPHSAEAERGVLGAILMDNTVIDRALEIIEPGDFYEARHRAIYAAMLALFDRGQPVDYVTLAEELRRLDRLEKIGGITYMAGLTEATPLARHVDIYAATVREKSLLRALISAVNEIGARAYDNPADVEEFLDEAEAAIFEVAGKKVRPSYYSLHDLIPETVKEIERLQKKQGGITGVPSGFADLDSLTAGFQPSDLIILAGRPGMGKTSLALNMARNAAIDHETPVAVFSLEMSRAQVALRLFCAEAKLDSRDIRRGFVRKEDWSKIMIASNILRDSKVFIDDTPAISVLEMKAKARRLVVEKGVGLVVVDYLQLMRGRQTRDGSREQEIADISRSLKGLAKELNIPVLALSQLNRAVESREDKRPRLADLRESGAIEQDADLILFIYRDKRYNEDTPDGDTAELNIGKHRNGPEEKIRLTFLEKYARFENFSGASNMPDFG